MIHLYLVHFLHGLMSSTPEDLLSKLRKPKFNPLSLAPGLLLSVFYKFPALTRIQHLLLDLSRLAINEATDTRDVQEMRPRSPRPCSSQLMEVAGSLTSRRQLVSARPLIRRTVLPSPQDRRPKGWVPRATSPSPS